MEVHEDIDGYTEHNPVLDGNNSFVFSAYS